MATRDDLRARLHIPDDRLAAINAVLLDPDTRVVNDLLDVVARYGSPEEINARAADAGKLSNLLRRLDEQKSPYRADLNWLIEQRDRRAFISVEEWRSALPQAAAPARDLAERFAVTLEISAAQYFPWLIAEARQSIAQGELMPARYIRVRKMRESESDNGDLLAFAAAMQIMGASWVETLDTKGTDGSNIHLGGPATIGGYFGGVGQPNDHPLLWADEFLYYYTTYGIRQVLNINPGTVLVGYLLRKLGIANEFKISVFMGNDNPYAALWTLIGAKLFSADDGSSPLVGFNFSNSVTGETIEITAQVREQLDFETAVRFEHHVTETWKSIVIQPYNRRSELLAVASRVANVSAKHEGGDPDIEQTRAHPSDLMDYFRTKQEVDASGADARPPAQLPRQTCCCECHCPRSGAGRSELHRRAKAAFMSRYIAPARWVNLDAWR